MHQPPIRSIIFMSRYRVSRDLFLLSFFHSLFTTSPVFACFYRWVWKAVNKKSRIRNSGKQSENKVRRVTVVGDQCRRNEEQVSRFRGGFRSAKGSAVFFFFFFFRITSRLPFHIWWFSARLRRVRHWSRIRYVRRPDTHITQVIR